MIVLIATFALNLCVQKASDFCVKGLCEGAPDRADCLSDELLNQFCDETAVQACMAKAVEACDFEKNSNKCRIPATVFDK